MAEYQVFDELHKSRLKGAQPVFEGSMSEVYKHLNGRRPEMHELSVKTVKRGVVSRASIWFVAARRVLITNLVKTAVTDAEEQDYGYEKPSVEALANEILEMF